MPIQRAAHCAYDLHYHFNFSVKYRRAVPEPEVVRELARISLEIQERYEIEVECLGADRDHVHLVCAAHPAMAPSRIAQVYKSLTARELYAALPHLRKRLWGGQFWGGRLLRGDGGAAGDLGVADAVCETAGSEAGGTEPVAVA